MRHLVATLALVGCAPGHASIPDGTLDPAAISEPVPPPGTGDPTGEGTPEGEPECPPVTDATRATVVTDIDETLTTSDSEWLTQIVLPGHDPAMRPDANALMQGYIDKGYRIVYITSRGELLRLLDGTTARDATEAWLDGHGFPYRSDDVYLAPGLAALNAAATEYKTGVIQDLTAAGLDVAWAYGNADTDVWAYQDAGIPDSDIFLVGELAGELGVVPIETADAYTAHLPFLETVPCGY
jgi:phosphatidate phosphatase PAH1